MSGFQEPFWPARLAKLLVSASGAALAEGVAEARGLLIGVEIIDHSAADRVLCLLPEFAVAQVGVILLQENSEFL